MKQLTIKDVSPREELVLMALYLTDRYGYEITKAISDASGGLIKLKPGTLYPALRDLETKGLIEGQWGDEKSLGARRRYYSLTSAGTKIVAELAEFRNRLVSNQENNS